MAEQALPPANDVRDAALAAATSAPSRVRRRRAKRAAGAPSSPPASPQLPTYDFTSLPEYLQDNEFIQTGYRYNLPVKDTLWSLFNLHNETGNVWSHLLGFLFFVGLTVWVSKSPPTPILLARPQLEELWHAVREHAQSIGGRSLGESLHHLQESLPRLPNLHSLPNLPRLPNLQSWTHTMHSLQESMHQSVHHLQDQLQLTAHSLQESVYSLPGRMQSGAHALADQLQHGLAALLPERLGPGAEDEALFAQGQLLAGLARGLHWPTARWPMYVFCAGAMSCLLLSAFCHLFGCCKKHIALFIWRLDYTGIALLIVSSFYPTVYYSFLCQPYLTTAYLSVISALGVAAMAMSLLECFQRPQWRPTRAGLYVGLGCMGVIPLLHVLVLHYDVWHVRAFVFRDVLMGVSYLVGAAIYALRVPERWFPGKFDLLLHSHQIFHLCVVLGAYLHYGAAMLLLEWRDASGGCAVPVTRPLNHMLEDLAAAGHDLLHIDQVWEWLHLLAEQMHITAASGPPTPAANFGAPSATALPVPGAQ